MYLVFVSKQDLSIVSTSFEDDGIYQKIVDSDFMQDDEFCYLQADSYTFVYWCEIYVLNSPTSPAFLG